MELTVLPMHIVQVVGSHQPQAIFPGKLQQSRIGDLLLFQPMVLYFQEEIVFAKNYPLEYPEPVSEFELIKSTNLKIKEVPVKMNKRAAGKSSISSWKTLYAGFNVLLSIIILTLKRSQHD